MKELVNPLLGTKYTRVFHEDEDQMQYNAPHRFFVSVSSVTEKDVNDTQLNINPIAEIHFQEGPIQECGVNGVANEDLLIMVITRLEHFQKSAYRCKENAVAITKLEEAMLWLRKRTMGRDQRGVEGTSII